ncbi:MAG TPA: FAD-dependent oxidoreductase [Candidatus Dormibacteraeota bacterium]|nr:FAD-dependent oxidoreductase [Candidatus Dormibacteraeota bacterium]
MTAPVWGIRPRRYPGRLPERADVLVVGGGITGVALLHWLRGRAGAVLVERDRLAAGASGRNAGFLVAGVAGSHAAAVRRYGRERAAALRAFTVETHGLLAAALGGRAPSYRPAGSDLVAVGPEEARDLEESCDLLRADGFDVSWDGARLRAPGDGELDPVEAVHALAGDAPDGAIREGVTVDGLEAGPDGVVVRAGPRECRAGAVVLATNAYTRLLAAEVPIEPVRAQMAATTSAAAGLVERPASADRGYRYWRQLPDGRVLAGGYRDRALEEEVGYAAVPTTRVQAYLDAHLRGLGVGAPVTWRWAGIMGFTADELPVVGPLAGRPGVWACGGYNGHGLAFAFQCARRVAEALTGARAATRLLP